MRKEAICFPDFSFEPSVGKSARGLSCWQCFSCSAYNTKKQNIYRRVKLGKKKVLPTAFPFESRGRRQPEAGGYLYNHFYKTAVKALFSKGFLVLRTPLIVGLVQVLFAQSERVVPRLVVLTSGAVPVGFGNVGKPLVNGWCFRFSQFP